MTMQKVFDIEIDKLTRSIENTITGDTFKTEVLRFSTKDFKLLKKSNWFFDWKAEANHPDTFVYKLVVCHS